MKKWEPVYVFGDSYADTGNHDPHSMNASINTPWRTPYGSTWPGQPSGRYSNGRLLTDFYVSSVGEKNPALYRSLAFDCNVTQYDEARTASVRSMLRKGRGISFAFGGSGVFDTLNPLVYNVSTQIDQLRSTIEAGFVTAEEIASSSVLFVVAGNDYEAYLTEHPDLNGIQGFIAQVVEQISTDIAALANLGFKKFSVTNLPPLGCVPYISMANNYTSCVDNVNQLCLLHNSLLEAQISILQSKFVDASFKLLDLYSSMLAVVKDGSFTLAPCCQGSCGDVNENGVPQYTMCSDVTKTLFWDNHHPTNDGWQLITKKLLA
ncbi:hypothetical protein KP509_14G049000 [Ceratopteris richardii]|nr:hypothetical protein KP509_14G049000 [Ceratopteris richardii]